MLTVLVWHSWQARPERERLGTALILLGMGGVFCFAYDVHRHSNLIFLPIAFASTRFLTDLRSRAAYLFLIDLELPRVRLATGVGRPVGLPVAWLAVRQLDRDHGHGERRASAHPAPVSIRLVGAVRPHHQVAADAAARVRRDGVRRVGDRRREPLARAQERRRPALGFLARVPAFVPLRREQSSFAIA